MPIIYLDHNIIATVAGLPPDPRAPEWRAAIQMLADDGNRFALSAWHAYELANFHDQKHVDACCDFVRTIRPLWLSNSQFVKREEIMRFLKHGGDHTTPVFNPSIAQMWTTYNQPFTIGETFANTVQLLRTSPGALVEIDRAAAETPNAILVARQAKVEGRYVATQPIVDREYFSTLINPPNRQVLDYVLSHMKHVLAACPTIRIEESLTRIRVTSHFRPKPSDAPDLQHAMVGLAYCDHFVSDDKNLSEQCRQAAKLCGLSCQVHRNPTNFL